MKSRRRMSKDEFDKVFDRHHKHWSEEEERKVINKIRERKKLPKGRWYRNFWQLLKIVGREVGRTPSALRARFGIPRLRVEWLLARLEEGDYEKFLRNISEQWKYRREFKKQLIKRDKIRDQDLNYKEVKDTLNDKKRNWKIGHDPNKLLIDNEDGLS